MNINKEAEKLNHTDIKEVIEKLANDYSRQLNERVSKRAEEMKTDNKDHYLVYRVLGISTHEGDLVDLYQNKGRFLYKYAGSFLEDAAHLCFICKYGKDNACGCL